MKLKLSPAEAEAVANLLNNHDFRTFLTAMGNYGEQVMHAYIWSAPDVRDTLQGKAQAVTEWVEAINEAPATVENYKKSK